MESGEKRKLIIAIFSLQILLLAHANTILEVNGQQRSGVCEHSFLNTSTQQYHGYRCRNFRQFPVNLNNSGSMNIETLDFDSKNNQFDILTDEMLIQANVSSNLLRLHLEKCKVRKIQEDSFKGGESIKELYLRDNLLEALDPSVFADLTSLEQLWLTRNPLKRFLSGKVFPKLEKLRTLDLGRCSLTTIETDLFKNLENLENLFLEENQLTTIDWKVVKPLKILKQVWLYDNPWHCDCHIGLLLKYLDNIEVDFELQLIISDLKCITTHAHLSETNSSAVGINWDKLDRELLVCPPKVSEFRQISQDKPKLGDSSHFQCEYSGYPPPEVQWMKNKQVIRIETGKVEVIQQNPEVGLNPSEESEYRYEFRQDLVLKNLGSDDGGIYECVASSLAGNGSKYVILALDLAGVARPSQAPVITTHNYPTTIKPSPILPTTETIYTLKPVQANSFDSGSGSGSAEKQNADTDCAAAASSSTSSSNTSFIVTIIILVLIIIVLIAFIVFIGVYSRKHNSAQLPFAKIWYPNHHQNPSYRQMPIPATSGGGERATAATSGNGSAYPPLIDTDYDYDICHAPTAAPAAAIRSENIYEEPIPVPSAPLRAPTSNERENAVYFLQN